MKQAIKLLAIALVFVVTVAAFLVHASASTAVDSAVARIKQSVGHSAPVAAQKPAAAATSSLDLNTVVARMNAAIATQPQLSAAATLIDTSTGTEYDAGSVSTIYKAASTAKVLAAVDYLHLVELGQATLTQTIDGMTAEQAMNRMIEISDNNAWAAFNDFLGDQQQTYAESIGMSSFTGGEYMTMTASDEAKLLAQLAEGKLINSSDRATLYNFMANTDSTNLIPAALPSGATVYHKYGELWGDLHDAAIINYQGKTYVLVVYTNNTDGTSDDYDAQVDLIHAVTSAVFSA